jgi:NDP-sugar pyrophosphorylase family protein
VPTLVSALDAIVAEGGQRDWAPRAFTAFAQARPLYALGTRGYPWIEIDFPEDYERAVQDVLPQVEAPPSAAAAYVSRPSLLGIIGR